VFSVGRKELIMFNTSGFHEAVGDTIALSVSTPQHLEKVGLLENYTDTEEDNINALMQIALQKVLQ
jgi:peptidyl-dipeptidase A